MQPFEVDIATRGKLVQIKGLISQSQTTTAKFLKAYREGYRGLLKEITQKIFYSGNEFCSSIASSLIISASEVYNLTSSSSVAYQLSIILTTLYIFVFSCLLNFKSQIYGQLATLFVCVIFFLLVLYIGFTDSYAAAGVLASVSLCLIAKSTVYLLEAYYGEEVTATFSLQSNLILLNYLSWKAYQVLLNELGLQSLDASNLVVVVIALSCLNVIKVYNIFDYEVIQIIHYWQAWQERREEDKKKKSMQMSQSISVYVKQMESDNSEIGEDDKVKQIAQVEERQKQEPEAQSKLGSDSVVKLNGEDLAVEYQAEPTDQPFQSNRRIITTVFTALVLAAYNAVVLVRYHSMSSSTFQTAIIYYASSIIRMTVLLLICDFLKVLHSQVKDSFNYICVFVCDCWWVLCSAFFMRMPSLLSLSIEESMVLSLSPLLLIKIFKHLDKTVHCQLDNGRYMWMVIGYLLPMLWREVAIVEGVVAVSYGLDGVMLAYAGGVLIVLACKQDLMYFWKDVRTLLSSKKNRLKIFQKLKLAKFQYETIIQNYLYFHVLFLNFIYYYFSDLSTLIEVVYYIIYLAPLLLNAVALINCHSYRSHIPDSYSPSILNLAVVVISLAYIGLAYSGVLEQNHQSWSLVVLLNVALFVLTLQGQKVAIIYLRSYHSFVRALVITTLFVLIYFPFIAAFCAGYFLTAMSTKYVFYYAISGFVYIWLLITVIGVSTHWILNLTEKSKKELFVAQYMENEMKKINIKQNMEKVLMISNMYEYLNYKSQDLLNYLKTEKHMLVAVRKEKEYEYDYELVDPQQSDKRRISIIAKPINPLDLIRIIDGRYARKATEQQSSVEQDYNNPVLNFFREKERNKIEVTLPQNVNRNLIEIKRMASKAKTIPIDLRTIEAASQFREMQGATNKTIGETIAKLYSFLSEPSKTISRETFAAFMRLLSKQEDSLSEINSTYNRFSQHSLMDEYKFKKFLLDYISFKYELREENLQSQLRTFCCREIVPWFLANLEPLNYYLRRKKVSISEESYQIWTTDRASEPESSEFSLLRQREIRKKAKLLKKRIKQRKTSKLHDENEKQEQVEVQDEEKVRGKEKKETVQKVEKQLKDKTFLKPENIYSILVNALIECYLFYEKEAENFKIKSIKFNLSNVLEILIKLNDIVFVFGYSTIYVLIAYYQADYSSGTPFLSYVPYQVLLFTASALMLVYIALIVYHKVDFETGTLGLDEEHRSLDFKQLKFWTKTIMFMMGSGLANYIIAIGLNSWICNSSTDTLFNFSDESCFSKTHYGYMLASLLILVLYWPLSVITYPFNTAMDRNLEIKYKVEYEVIYLQVKFMINGFNTLLNPFAYQTEQLIGSVLKVILCCALAILYNRLQPCSYELLNIIEGKVYIILAVLSFAGAMCYFVGLLYSVVATGSLLLVYMVYFIYATIKSYGQLQNDKGDDEIIEDIVKNQKIRIQIIRQSNGQKDAAEDTSASNLRRTDNVLVRSRLQTKKKDKVSEAQVTNQTIYYNDSLKVVSSSNNTRGSHLL